MTKVPDSPQLKPTKTDTAIYCFPLGTSDADKQHDIDQVNKFVEHIKAKRKSKK